MAYLFGLVTKKEAAALKKRGWTLEDPQDMIEEAQDTAGDLHERQQAGTDKGNAFVGVYVDTNLFEVMSGPDWDKGR
jgi:hypothetical protein